MAAQRFLERGQVVAMLGRADADVLARDHHDVADPVARQLEAADRLLLVDTRISSSRACSLAMMSATVRTLGQIGGGKPPSAP